MMPWGWIALGLGLLLLVAIGIGKAIKKHDDGFDVDAEDAYQAFQAQYRDFHSRRIPPEHPPDPRPRFRAKP